jgi:uncharacterized SAM-dependent methyltransferase
LESSLESSRGGRLRRWPLAILAYACNRCGATASLQLPVCKQRLAYYPGSTIENFVPGDALRFLTKIAEVCGRDGGLLIGVDLKKDPLMLHRAYNDALGVTSAFNLNILARLNREFRADFVLDQFRHHAFYNPVFARVEMHLISLTEQVVRIGAVSIHFERSESIWTEATYKYNPPEFAALVAGAGWRVDHVWTDDRGLYSVQYLRAMAAA